MEKKKILKTVTALAFAAMVATSSLGVAAKSSYVIKEDKTFRVDLTDQYYVKPSSFVKTFYDYGTTAWYDDAWATTEVKSNKSLSVTSKVYLCDEYGHCDKSSNNEKRSTTYVHSGNACIEGYDYATYVKHEAYRKTVGTKTANGYIYRYKQAK